MGILGIETIHWHTLHPRYLNSSSRVIDLGANFGWFSRKIVKRFGCAVEAVEPSPEIFDSMQAGEGVRKHRLAIAPRSGPVLFHVAAESRSSSMMHVPADARGEVSVEGVTLEDFVRGRLGWSGGEGADLIKMDIEGAEIEVLAGCSDAFLRSVGQLTIEFHDFCGIVPAADVRRTIGRLADLGFYHVRMSRVGHQDTWLINRNRCPISAAECAWIRHFSRNWLGAGRLLRKAMGRPLE